MSALVREPVAQPHARALPVSLLTNPRLSAWLRIDARGQVVVSPGKVELGQGILHALAQIVADELGLDPSQVRVRAAVTGDSPDEAVTSGSLSIQQSGSALRHVAAQVRVLMLESAALAHHVPASALRLVAGAVMHGDRLLCSLRDFADSPLLDVDAVADVAEAVVERRWVGQSTQRDDIADKVFGQFTFIHDLVLPAMVHGRVIRPPSPDATLLSLRADPVRAWPGVIEVCIDGSQVGVIAETEVLAVTAAERLASMAEWSELPTLPDEAALPAWLKTLPSSLSFGFKRPAAGELAPVVDTVRAAYSRPFIRHASIGPSCSLACWSSDRLDVWSHSQGIYNLRKDLGLAFDRPVEGIVVRHVQGAGCYGHNGADDVAYDAAWLARACPGRPVRVQWSRADEFNWSPVGPAMAIELEADVDAGGDVVAWRHESWSPGHGLRPGRGATPTLLGSWYLARPFERSAAVDAPRAVGGGADRNADPGYAFPTFQIACRRVTDVPMRTSALRALGAFANVFAIESFVDELARRSGRDPLAYRLAQLTDTRAIDVLETVARQAGWQASLAPAGLGTGRGIGFARYKNTGAWCAVIADVEVAERVRVVKLHIAVDVGLAVNPDGVRQQIEGGAVQATSWTLFEAAHFDRTRMHDDGWERYPILRFADAPEIDVSIMPTEDQPSLGAGEASLGPTAAAIGNAVADALGVRVRDLPLTPDRIIRAMDTDP